MSPRLSFVLSSLWLSGGVLLVVEYANRLARRGWQVTLVTPKDTLDPAVQALLADPRMIRESALSLPKQRSPQALLALARALSRAIPASDIIVATHTPTVVPVQWASRWDKKGRRVWLYMDYPEMFRARPMERALLHYAPAWFESIATISQPLSEAVRPHARCPVVMTGSGVRRPDLFRPPAEPRHRHLPARILYVGDERPRKGMREVLQAVAQVRRVLPDVLLVIASKMPCSFDLTIPHEFHLCPSDETLARLYQTSEVLVSASWGEGLGYPPMEAMACGTPVVLTNSQGVLDYARNGENCLLVPPQDAPAIERALLQVLTDPALAQRLAQQGPEITRRYSWDSAVERFEAAVKPLL